MGKYVDLVTKTNKVGKQTPTEWYGHIDAIDVGLSNISKKNLERLNKAKKYLNKDFKFNFVAIGSKEVRFLKMSSLEEPHPYVIESKKVDNDGNIKNGKVNLSNPLIYHRINTIISPKHYTFEFHNAITKYEEENGFLKFDGKFPSGYYNNWMKQIKQYRNVDEKEIKKNWENIKKHYLH